MSWTQEDLDRLDEAIVDPNAAARLSSGRGGRGADIRESEARPLEELLRARDVVRAELLEEDLRRSEAKRLELEQRLEALERELKDAVLEAALEEGERLGLVALVRTRREEAEQASDRCAQLELLVHALADALGVELEQGEQERWAWDAELASEAMRAAVVDLLRRAGAVARDADPETEDEAQPQEEE